MEEFSSSWQALSRGGSVVEFTFGGVHHWTHGPEMVRYVKDVLAEKTTDAIVINLDGYRYEFGNDFYVLFTVGLDKVTRRVRPVCIVAHGQTEVSLKTLFAASNTAGVFDITFVNTNGQLAEWLHRKASEKSA